MKKIKRIMGALLGIAISVPAIAQSELYPGHSDLEEVTLLDGPFKTAMNLNVDMLLKYDTDRLLTPFVRQAGLDKAGSKYSGWVSQHPSFTNWGDSGWSLEGHVGGHYLSALSLAYAACHDEAKMAKLKQRIDHMLEVMKDCQSAYSSNTKGMRGFIGGQPINQAWTDLYNGSTTTFAKYGGWVPFYCQHKVLAGLRDAYLYTDGESADVAKELFRGLADWSVNVISKLDTNTMQQVLGWEHGGMNETLADAYSIFGDAKYLKAAKAYSHTHMLNGMQSLNTTFLNGMHANTQVPKYIGFERIYEEDKTAKTYKKAAENFWTDVAKNRTVCIGGNSVNEHFLSQDGSSYVNQLDGPESCNTNNMLKLSEDLFDRTHDAKYADFYEAAMWNHILSTQDPKTGGYVYFTPLRPQSYKIYSQPNKGMWCCVGTGMENHSKYGHFIYTHSVNVSKNENYADTLFVNLFTASELNSEKFGIRQETDFPYEQKTKLTITKAGKYVLAIRKPQWTDGKAAKYTCYDKTWREGETVEVDLPMELRYEECPNLSDYIAFKYGPILLGARTNNETGEGASNGLKKESLTNEYAGEGRMDHSESCMTKSLSLATAPMLIGKRSEVLNRITMDAEAMKTLRFRIDVSRTDLDSYKWNTLTLEPYYKIHHSRLMNYWYQQTEEGYANSSWAKEEAAKMELERRTVDFVATGEQQSEAGHNYRYSSDSGKGSYQGEYYRDAQKGGYIQYTLYNNEGLTDSLSIMCRFTTADNGRKGTLKVDGVKIASIEISKDLKADDNGFYNVQIDLPQHLIVDANGKAKSKFVVRLDADQNTICPGWYYLRLLHGYTTHTYKFYANEWKTGDAGRVAQSNISYDTEANTIKVKAGTGDNNVCLTFDYGKHGGYAVSESRKYLVVWGQGLSTASGKNYLWWLNGVNRGSSVTPSYAKKIDAKNVVIAWDISKSGIADNCNGDGWNPGIGSTIFGMTSTTGTATICDIGFESDIDAYVERIISTTAIRNVSSNSKTTEVFSLSGAKLKAPQQGVNIIRENGKSKKMIINDEKKHG
ncbi:MAG: glycoside hydrolase family 127 protein [Prevotellaceae bacterium]|nr:glycoside hydrolase family 127 protein [Candidatus Minthosoma caballi]